MNNKIIIYNTEDGKAKINLELENGTAYLTQNEIAELFDTTKQNIGKHIKNIFQDSELNESMVVNYKFTTMDYGKIKGKKQTQKVAYYNLDMILGIGEDLLQGNGKVSHKMMENKVDKKYKKYSEKTLTQVEKDYLNEIKAIEKKAKVGSKK